MTRLPCTLQIRATGETRSDMLAKAGVNVSKSAPPLPPNTDSAAAPVAKAPQQSHPAAAQAAAQAATVQPKPPVNLSDLDVIDRIAAESVRLDGADQTQAEVGDSDSAASSQAEAQAEAAAVAQLEELLTRLPIKR